MIVYGCAFDSSIFLVRSLSNRKLIPAFVPRPGPFYDDGKWRRRMGWLDSSGMAVDYFSVDGVKDWHTIC